MILLKEGTVDRFRQHTAVSVSDEKEIEEEILVNWPDLMFTGYCCESFQINRGIFNTAENWLYRRGFTDILSRRAMLLRFFRFANDYREKNQNRFGNGGLTECLETFMCSISDGVRPSAGKDA